MALIFGYISKDDAVIKVEQYFKQAGNNAKILLMDLSKTFDTINRALALTDDTIRKRTAWGNDHANQKRTRMGADLHANTRGYGKLNEDNVGVFRGSAISEVLLIIYLDGVMEDLEALSRRTNLPIRIVQDRPHQQKRSTTM